MCTYCRLFFTLVVLSLASACGGGPEPDSHGASDSDVNDNILLAEWTGPYSGIPAFDKMSLDALKPALESGMALNLEEIEKIAENPELAVSLGSAARASWRERHTEDRSIARLWGIIATVAEERQ